MIRFAVGKSIDAKTFEAKTAKEFRPTACVVVSTIDKLASERIQGLLDRFKDQIEAYAILQTLDDETYSIHLQFFDEKMSDEFHRSYNISLRNQPPKSKATKRLPKDRMYLLSTGERFWYYAKWDNRGQLVGKVLDGLNDCLVKKVVSRTELEIAELIPKGDETWTPKMDSLNS